MRLRVAGVVLFVTVLGAGVGSAGALGGRAATSVRLDEIVARGGGHGTYSGHLSSPRPRCERRRTVEILQPSSAPPLIGQATSDRDGTWKLTGELPPDGETVIVHALRTKRCKGDRESYEVRR